MHLDIIKVIYLPIDAQENCFKTNIKIYIKTAPTCFGAITIIRYNDTMFFIADLIIYAATPPN